MKNGDEGRKISHVYGAPESEFLENIKLKLKVIVLNIGYIFAQN